MREAHLRDFIAAIETGSVRSAARHLGLTQAAVSKNLSALERSFGLQLLVRSARGIEPTEYGKLVLRRARLVDAELRKLDEELSELSGKRHGVVSIGISSTAEALLMPRALMRFQKNYPDTMVSIIGGPPASIIKAIREGHIDFAVCPAQPANIGNDINVERLLSTDIVVVGRKGHAISGATSLEKLIPYAWVIGARQSNAETTIRAAFLAQGLPAPTFTIQRDSFSALLHMLLQTDFLAASSYPAIETFCTHGLLEVVPVDIKFAPMVQCLITSTLRPLTQSAETLATEFRRVSRMYRR
ncbi:LysR substrate-binding domain-containing protein [Caballeronia sp. dw_19]|uniref:LysR family transcriptional regulator n=1 Tax=Caballeronia sp. dw_19 TaxID=2719791 RepID=UPI001BD51688|nr:LysR substrate-binding domain-containing protein [Caballeronia sp. dw_19]